MIQRLIFWVFLVHPGIAWGQDTVFVRAGEHPSYSRLVIQIERDLPWEFRTIGRRAVLTLPETDTEFDVSEVFKRIPKTRILSLRSVKNGGDTELAMTFGCACEAQAKIESNLLIIDVSESETSLGLGTKPSDLSEMTSDLPPPRPASPTTIAEMDPGTQETQERPTIAENQELESIESGPPTNEQNTDETIGPNDVADLLIQQLNRAAEQGLVELATQETVVTPNAEPDVPMMEPEKFLARAEEDIDGLEAMAKRFARELSQPEIGGSVAVRVPETISTLSRPGQLPEIARLDKDTNAAKNENCIDPNLLDVRHWSDERPAAIQISDLRGKLFGEFDKPDTNTALDLVRLYIAYGFGLEAQTLISDLGLSGYEVEVLNEIATSIDGQQNALGGHLDKAAGCGGSNDLWRAVALGTTESLPIPEPDEIITFFAEMPILVRRLLAPSLIQSFLARNQVEEATRLLEIVDRSPGTDNAALVMARAQLDHTTGKIHAAEQAFSDLVRQGGPESVPAAILLTESIVARGAKVPDLLVQDLEALVRVHRGTDLGSRLRLSEISAKAGSDRLDDALKVVREQSGGVLTPGSELSIATNSILSDASIQKNGVSELLKALFKNSDLLTSPAIYPETRVHLANQFVESGLPNSAWEFLTTNPENTPDGQDFLLGQALLAMDLSTQALEALSKNTSEQAAVVRAKAYAKSGDYSMAYKELVDFDIEENLARFAWLANDWNAAVGSDDPTIQTMAEFMMHRKSPKVPSPSVLSEVGVLALDQNADVNGVQQNRSITLELVEDVQLRSQETRDFISSALSLN